MRNISILMLFVAIVLGAITVFFARSFIESQRLLESNGAAQTEQIQTTTIVVATVPLKFGDEMTLDNLKVVDWPVGLKPEGSFESVNAIIGDQRRVVLRSISTNEPVVKNKISGFGFRASLSQIIKEGNRAVTIRVNDVASVGGFVLPGDEVDVVLSYQDGEDVLDMISKVILQKVRVLAIDQISDEAQEGAIVGKAATIEVSPEEGQKIALASRVGVLSLALRRFSTGDFDENIQTKVIKVSDLDPSGLGDQKVDLVKKPYSPVRTVSTSRAEVPAVPTNGSMMITRGIKSSEETVAAEGSQSLAGFGYPTSDVTMIGANLTKSVASGVANTADTINAPLGQ